MTDDDVSSGSNHGWQKVVNPKRQRRQDATQESKSSKILRRPASGESEVFQALEVQAADRRRAHRDSESTMTSSAPDLTEDTSNKVVIPTEKLPKGKKPKKAKASPRELGAAIDPVDLGLFLDGVTESYMSVPEVQLMRFADYFGRIFDPISASQFAWDTVLQETPLQDAIEIPFCYLSDGASRVAYEWLARKPADELWKFTVWLLKAAAQSRQGQLSSQKSKVGVLVVLALVLRKRPEILLQHASVIRSDAEQLGLDKLHFLAWTCGQAAQGDLVIGMSLWVQILLPLAVGKSSTPASRHVTLQFIESVLLANLKKARAVLLNGVSKKGERLVPPAAFDCVMRLAYPPDSAQTKATERFSAIYPLVKELCLAGSFGTKATRPIAQQLLPLSLNAAGSDVEALSHEARQNFVWCLQQNPECYRQWEQLHLSNLRASVGVLRHLCSTWKENVARLAPLNDLRRVISSFKSMHKTAFKTAKVDKESELLLKEADHLCKLVSRKTSGFPACGKATATLVCAVVLGYGFYLLSPPVNPWKWDGQILLSKTHSFF